MTIHTSHSFEHYHSTPHFGSTTAKLAVKSMQLLKDRIDGVDVVKAASHFSVGTLIHMAVLEPDRFKEQIVTDGPINDKTGKPYGRDTQKFSDWQAANPEKIVVDPWIYTLIARCPDRVKEVFSQGQAEVSVYQEINGVQIKCRPDHLIDTRITDFKTIADMDKLERDMTKWDYWFSDAWYRNVMFLETGKKHSFDFVFAEKKPPFRWRIAKLDADYKMYADDVVLKTIEKIGAAQKSGDWSDKDDIEVMVSRPDWVGDEVDDDETDE